MPLGSVQGRGGGLTRPFGELNFKLIDLWRFGGHPSRVRFRCNIFALLFPTLAACASTHSTATASATPQPPRWTREAGEYVCRTLGVEKVRFKLNERHSWDEVEVQPPPGGAFAWTDSSGTYLARFDFDHTSGSSTLRYYGGDCGLRFSKELRWEPLTAHVLLEGERLLLAMAKPYTLQWGDHWVPYFDILLFDDGGRMLLRHGPLQAGIEEPFVFYQSGRYARVYSFPYDLRGRREPVELFLDLWKGLEHIYYINEKEGRPPGFVAITPKGKIEVYNNATLNRNLFDDLADDGLIEGPDKPKPIYEYQFP